MSHSSRSSVDFPRLSREGKAWIGYLSINLAGSPHITEGFRQGLRDLGYVEGRNVLIEFRDAEGKLERLPALAAELVALKVDVVVVGGTVAAVAVKQATKTVPIVFVSAVDPVTDGLVASLARPEGNVTGLATLAPELVGKRLEHLRQIVPAVSQVAVLGNQVPSANAQKRTCARKQKARHGCWECGFNSLRSEGQAISTGPSRI